VPVGKHRRMAATAETGLVPRYLKRIGSGITQRQVGTTIMLDRRNFLGFAATATVATAIGLAAGQTITIDYSAVARPQLESESDASGSSRHQRRSMRQAAVAPDEGVGAPTDGESQGTGVHPRRAARDTLEPTDEAGVTIADADFSQVGGRDGRGARVTRP